MGRKQNIYNYIILAMLVIYNFVYKFIVLKWFRYRESIITSVFLILLFIFSIVMFGFAKSKLNRLKKNTTRLVTIVVIIGIILTYCIGVFVGFVRNGYSLAISNIVMNITTPILIIVFTELFRYNIIRANKNKFKMVILFTALLTILELQMNMLLIANWGFEEIFVVITTIAIPIIAKNMVLSYLSYQVGYQPCLMYRLILEIYIFLVPYLPKFGDYLNSMFGLILPMVLFICSLEDIERQDIGEEQEYISKKADLWNIPIYIVMTISIILISRIFPVFAIGVGSESMTGAINKGDAVIACKVKEENIAVNDVIVFQAKNKILIHRVVEIEEIDGEKYYRTKGDVSGTRDNIDITIDKIYGEVKLKIPFIAYPSVWLTEFVQAHK